MEYKYIFGPVPSRRMGSSLGISPIPEKTCNYSCVYCQLGRTDQMTNVRRDFFPVEDILAEFQTEIQHIDCDVVTIVGEGEPTLYSNLGLLIDGMHKITDKPIAVITNGALLYDPEVRADLMRADLVLPSCDAYDEESFNKIDRPIGSIKFQEVQEGLVEFSKEYKGQLWLEIMLIDGMNTSEEALQKMKNYIDKVRHDRVYINTPVRPPAEEEVNEATEKSISRACGLMEGISIEQLAAGDFHSEYPDHIEALVHICSRHPMNQFEVNTFLDSRKVNSKAQIIEQLKMDSRIQAINYKGIYTFRARSK